MIRSSTHTLKFSNKQKKNLLNQIFIDFKDCVVLYQKLIISGQLPLKNNLSSKELPDPIIKHSQWRQIAFKTASEIIRSNLKFVKNKTFKKYKKLYHKASKQERRSDFLSKRFSELNINYLKRIKIDVKNISLNLDERLVDFQESNYFDEFVRIKSPYFQEEKKRAILLKVPIKHHRHSNKFKDWTRKNTVRLRNKNGLYLDFIYEKEQTPLRSSGSSIGFDSGYKKLLVDSNGVKHGIHLEEIYTKLSRKKRGSKNYNQYLQHKKNEINRVINNLELSEINQVILEDLKNVKKNSKFSKKFNNKLQYWSFRQVIDKLVSRSEIEGFYVHFVDPAYTSQTCSTCGVVDKSNRKGEIYQCTSCGLVIDADYNAAINILNRGVYNPPDKENEFIDFYRNS